VKSTLKAIQSREKAAIPLDCSQISSFASGFRKHSKAARLAVRISKSIAEGIFGCTADFRINH
jgi:hypothetical protein